MQVYLLGALLFFVALAVFVFQNTAMVTVHFLNWVSPDVSLAVVVLIAACAGALVTFLVDSFRYFKIAKRIKELTGMNKKLQNEVRDLKNRSSKEKKGEKKAEPDPGQGPE
ncbi:LapA family protein [Syntrophomonas curvata]